MKILDCTIRDGGYYNNWDFEKRIAENYIQAANHLPIDYLEIGYRSKPMKEYFGEYFYCPEYVIKKIRKISNKRIAIMINEKDTKPDDLKQILDPCSDSIDMVRIAVDPEQIVRAMKLAEGIKNLGFETAFNVMYLSKWKQDKSFMTELKSLKGLADYLYMVDSYGGIFPNELEEIITLIKTYTDVPLGFHGHNNIELALINSLTALKHGTQIIDATILGMGRGAGNLKTELLLTALNQQVGLPVDFNALGNIVNHFKGLYEEYGWGTNLPYMISGANSFPQKDVMDWVTKRFYSFNSIIRALQNKKNSVVDNQKLREFKPKHQTDKVIIVGGGPNAVLHSEALKEYLAKEKNACIIHASSKNSAHYKDIPTKQYFCLVGNEGRRLEEVLETLKDFSGACILPPFPRKMGTYVPKAIEEMSYELPQITFTKLLNDSHTVLALETAILLGAKEIEVIGYDGYREGSITQLEKSLVEENEKLFNDFEKFSGKKIISLTDTNYKNLKVEAIYSKLT